MALGLKSILAGARENYDRVIAAVVAVGLLFSMLYLAVAIGESKSKQASWERQMSSHKAKHPCVAPADFASYSNGLEKIRDPGMLAMHTWTNKTLLVPERRVWCSKDGCHKPIPYDADICPFCLSEQLKDKDAPVGWDTDGDKMPDVWEQKFGLDPKDPSDAAQDKDGDGFTNIEEFNPRPELATDPTDPKSHPPYAEFKAYVSEIKRDPFMLRFKAVNVLAPGTNIFQVNLRGNVKTYFGKLGDVYDGFKLMKHEVKKEMRQPPGWPKPREMEIDYLTLQRGDKVVTLEKGNDFVEYIEYTATVILAIDSSKYEIKTDSVLSLKDDKYKVNGIDTANETVVVTREQDGKNYVIRKLPESKPANSGEGGAEPPAKPAGSGENPR